MKNVLITGASRGIGEAAARRFAGAGYRLFLNCKTSEQELKSLSAELRETFQTDCTPLLFDVSSDTEVEAMFKQIQARCSGIDVLVNNAGISYIGLLDAMEISDWNRVLDTNLTSVFSCCKRALPHMISQKSGKIINVSSVWGNVGASCEAAYSASKGGVNALTKALAKELAPSNIQVNAIACGVIDTRMNSGFSEEELAALRDEIPAGRFGSPDEAASLILTLAESSSYLTGQVITLDGGWS